MRQARRTSGWMLAIVLTALASAGVHAQQPPLTPGPPPAWGADVRAQPPSGGGSSPILKGPQIDLPGTSNTTVTPRTTTSTEQRTSGQVAFVAQLTDDTGPLETGVVWRIFRDRVGPDGKPRLLSQHREAAPQLRLDVGDYLVHAAFGRAHLTRRITVPAGRQITEKFVLNAGALRIAATLASGEPAPENTVSYRVFGDERDQLGNRTAILRDARPGVLVRLNAGIYQVESLYGDANAIVRGEITVEPGKVTEATLAHIAAKATFKLVERTGGTALADTQWTITNGQGETVKDSAGALPSHVFAPGAYTVIARRLGETYRREFSLQGGDNVEVEVIASRS